MFLKKHAQTTSILLVVIFLAIAAVVPAYASPQDELDAKLQEQENLNERMRQERINLQQQRGREEALKEELGQLDSSLEALRAELNRLADEIKKTEAEIAVIEAELAEAEARLAYRESLLKRRLRAIHEHGSVTFLEVLLDSSSFSQFLTRLRNMQHIISNDQELLDEVRAERSRIQTEKEKLDQKKSELEGMRRETRSREEEVERTMASRAGVLAELQDEITRRQSAIREMEHEAEALERLIIELLRARSGGAYDGFENPFWPVDGSNFITSFFGWRRSPFTGAWQYHGGIDIGGLWNRWPLSRFYIGRPAYVLAADDGVVAFSGISEGGGIFYQRSPGRDEFRNPQYWTRAGAFGSLIIIDHGTDGSHDWSSVYAHLHSRLVGEGDHVVRGQRIAVVGSTGSSTGPHLHFEVRRDNIRIDPLLFQYIR